MGVIFKNNTSRGLSNLGQRLSSFKGPLLNESHTHVIIPMYLQLLTYTTVYPKVSGLSR